MRKALITGITGQDGSYLAEFLLSKGYEVHGIVRRVAFEDPQNRMSRIFHILDKIVLHPGNVENYARIIHILNKVKPDECYHLAAQSFVHESFEDGFSTIDINIKGTHNVLSALREVVPSCRFYFAGSSEMFGKAQQIPQTEETKFYPRSPYGISKVTGYELTRNYKESYGIFASSGILFNHESPRRGLEFVTRKITNAAARI
ncbi:MAG: GDP-mannose 4,6-dehydratase, partial [Patescibacteria group bacterium]